MGEGRRRPGAKCSGFKADTVPECTSVWLGGIRRENNCWTGHSQPQPLEATGDLSKSCLGERQVRTSSWEPAREGGERGRGREVWSPLGEGAYP